MPYFILTRETNRPLDIQARGPMDYTEAFDCYQSTRRTIGTQVHPPINAGSAEEAIEKSQSATGFFHD